MGLLLDRIYKNRGDILKYLLFQKFFYRDIKKAPVHLFYVPYAVQTLDFFTDELWNDMWYQANGFIPNLRNGRPASAWEYMKHFANMHGGVFITNKTYFCVGPIVAAPESDDELD